MTDGQIHPFDTSGIEPSREAHPLQRGLESRFGPQAHHVGDANQLSLPVAFFHLAVDQTRCHLPLAHVPPSTSLLPPSPKMGREGIKVHIEAIAREKRETERRPRCVVESG